jgi:hypothetical protein
MNIVLFSAAAFVFVSGVTGIASLYNRVLHGSSAVSIVDPLQEQETPYVDEKAD